MASNYTENYQLCQWEATDAVQRLEFNADNAKIDAALAQKGNCQFYAATYTGSGKVQWDNNTVTWQHSGQNVSYACNTEGSTYYIFAITSIV